MKTIETRVPFSGFYHSFYESRIDDNLKDRIHHYCDNWDFHDFGILREIFHKYATFDDCRNAIAQEHCTAFFDIYKDEFGIDLKAEYVEFTSPKYYNFETDKLYARVSLNALKELWNWHKQNDFVLLGQYIKERFTSRDGFISFITNDLQDWIESDWESFHQDQIMALIVARDTNRDCYDNSINGMAEDALLYNCDGLFECTLDFEEIKQEVLALKIERQLKDKIESAFDVLDRELRFKGIEIPSDVKELLKDLEVKIQGEIRDQAKFVEYM